MFCDDDFDPVTGKPDEWTEADQKRFVKRRNKMLEKVRKELDKNRKPVIIVE